MWIMSMGIKSLNGTYSIRVYILVQFEDEVLIQTRCGGVVGNRVYRGKLD